MVNNAIIQYKTNLVIWVGESENPILTPPPDFVIDITNYEGEVEVGMIWNAESNTFTILEENT